MRPERTHEIRQKNLSWSFFTGETGQSNQSAQIFDAALVRVCRKRKGAIQCFGHGASSLSDDF